MPTEQELAEFYSRRAEHGNYELAKVSERDEDLIRVLEFAEQYCQPPRRRLFDVGCFEGGLLDLAAMHGWEGWGLELQTDAAAVAEKKHPNRIFAGTVEGYSEIRSGQFDLVTAIGLVEHLRKPRRLFEIAQEMLRPGGVLVIQTPNRRSLPARLLGRYWPPIAAPEHTHYFAPNTLSRLSKRFDLKPIALKPHWKRLRIDYMFHQFRFFGPEFHRALRPLMRILPERVTRIRMPVYGGEMLFAARLASGPGLGASTEARGALER